MHISSVIEQLGYSPSEVKIYLAALDIGESTITDLAEKVCMPRTSVQGIVEQMHRRGLMNFFLKRKRRLWVAENPEKLLIGVKEREAALKSIMPELQAKRFSHGGRPVVQIFNGPSEIKLIMQDILDTQHNVLTIVSWDEWRAFFGDKFVDNFIDRRAQRFLQIKLLAPRTQMALELQKQDSQQLRHTRFLPEQYEIHNSNFIYGNKSAIISLNKRKPVGIVMDDADIAHTMGVLFECLWQQSSDR